MEEIRWIRWCVSRPTPRVEFPFAHRELPVHLWVRSIDREIPHLTGLPNILCVYRDRHRFPNRAAERTRKSPLRVSLLENGELKGADVTDHLDPGQAFAQQIGKGRSAGGRSAAQRGGTQANPSSVDHPLSRQAIIGIEAIDPTGLRPAIPRLRLRFLSEKRQGRTGRPRRQLVDG